MVPLPTSQGSLALAGASIIPQAPNLAVLQTALQQGSLTYEDLLRRARNPDQVQLQRAQAASQIQDLSTLPIRRQQEMDAATQQRELGDLNIKINRRVLDEHLHPEAVLQLKADSGLYSSWMAAGKTLNQFPTTPEGTPDRPAAIKQLNEYHLALEATKKAQENKIAEAQTVRSSIIKDFQAWKGGLILAADGTADIDAMHQQLVNRGGKEKQDQNNKTLADYHKLKGQILRTAAGDTDYVGMENFLATQGGEAGEERRKQTLTAYTNLKGAALLTAAGDLDYSGMEKYLSEKGGTEKQIGQASVDKLETLKTLQQQIPDLKKLFAERLELQNLPGYMNPVAGQIGKRNPWDDNAKAIANLQRIMSPLIENGILVGGRRDTKDQRDSLVEVTPNITDTPHEIDAKIKKLEQLALDRINTTLDTLEMEGKDVARYRPPPAANPAAGGQKITPPVDALAPSTTNAPGTNIFPPGTTFTPATNATTQATNAPAAQAKIRKPSPIPAGQPGGSEQSPILVTSQAQYNQLKPGTWMKDKSGNVHQRAEN